MAMRQPKMFGEVLSGLEQSSVTTEASAGGKLPSDMETMLDNLRALQERNRREDAEAKEKGAPGAELRSGSARPRVATAKQPVAEKADRQPVKQASDKRQSMRVLSEKEAPRLPFWPDSRRGVSNDMARSALFTVRQGQERSNFKGKRVASLKNVEIIYTGEELRQRDEDVFFQLLHYGRLANIDDPISFVAVDMLQQLGWTINSRSYRELADSITRMKASSIHIVTRTDGEERGYGGSLIRSFEYRTKLNSGAAQWIITFEKRIINLFSRVSYTQIDWEQRLRLSVLSKWLHTFYFTHQVPFPMKVATLRELCGSSTKNLAKFRQQMRGSLDELVSIGFLTSWSISKESDLVEVVRNLVPKIIPVIE